MSESVFSPFWHRVCGAHPQLRTQVTVMRQHYRGTLWFVLQDRSSGKHFRLDEAGYQFVGRLDGRHSVQQVWDALVHTRPEKAPTQSEVVRLLGELSEAELLRTEYAPEFDEIFRRRDERRAKRNKAFVNPLAFRVPLFDPTRLLNRLMPFARVLFSVPVLIAWLALISVGTFAALGHWPELRGYADVHLPTAHFWLLLWLSYPVIKALHELGHALATRVWGGEVHDMGVTLLLLVPVPYVDASAASAFREKRRRALVGAAGVMVELALAASAALLWLMVEDGLLRELAFVAMFVGTVSTLLFNGNPLMRFDAYYVLSDALELPNLAARSRAYLAYLAQRYLLGISSVRSPAATRGERCWLIGYGVAAWGYRFVLSIAVAVWVSAKSVFLALLLLAWFSFSLVVMPIWRVLGFLLTSSRLTKRRARAIGVAVALCAGVLLLFFAVPLPLSTQVEGVVWLPEQARVRAATEGFISEVLAADGQSVKRGDALLVMRNPKLSARRDELQAQLRRLATAHSSALAVDLSRAQALTDETAKVTSELKQVSAQIDGLVLRSAVDGTLVLPHVQDILGSYVAKGALLAHVLAPQDLTIRALLPHDAAALVRERSRGVQVRLTDAMSEALPARIHGETPQASNELPSAALGDKGGGTWTTDPAEGKGMQSLEPFFVVDLRVPARVATRVGGRAYAQFDLGSEPLAQRLQRAGRRLFLRHFAVGNV